MNVAHATHLGRRFVTSLWPGGPGQAGEQWVAGHLLPGELELWKRMSGADRRHALGVARRVERDLGHEASRAVVAAALLHDVGKVAARIGTLRRVAATVVDPRPGWENQPGWRRRFALYRDHGRLGADMLSLAESDPLTIAWAAQHHLPPGRWTLPRPIADALKAADDD
jgi:hypothetical protein